MLRAADGVVGNGEVEGAEKRAIEGGEGGSETEVGVTVRR